MISESLKLRIISVLANSSNPGDVRFMYTASLAGGSFLSIEDGKVHHWLALPREDDPYDVLAAASAMRAEMVTESYRKLESK